MKKKINLKTYFLRIIFENSILIKIILIICFIFELLMNYFQIQLKNFIDLDYNSIHNSIENNFAKYICEIFVLDENYNCLK